MKRQPGLLTLTLIASLTMVGPVRAQDSAVTAETETVTAPVELDGDVLFRVRGVTSFPADMRARVVRDRIATVAADPAIAVDAIRVAEVDGQTRIVAGNVTIMTIVEADASLEQVGRAELAATHVFRVRQAVLDYRAARSPGALRRAAANVLVAALVLVVTVVALLWFWRRASHFLMRKFQARIHSVGIQSFELIRAEQIWTALQGGLLAFRTIVLLVVGLVYVGFTLAQFPRTRGLSRDLVSFVIGPVQVMGDGILANIPSLVFLTVLVFIVRLVLRIVRLFFEAVGGGTVSLPGFEREWGEPTYKIVRFAIWAFALVVAFPYIPGSSTDAFRGVSVFIGILFSFGSSSAISNIIAGYMLTYRRALKVGDLVKIGGTVGEVIETRLQATYLRSPKNEEIIIPNSQILAGEVLNYTSLARTRGLILHTEVGIGYETPWRQVEAMLSEAADRTQGVSRDPRPFVLERRLGDFAIAYELNAYCHTGQAMLPLYAALHRNILDVFNEHGVQIMTPAYEHDPAEPKVVPEKDWYAAPAARTAPAEPEGVEAARAGAETPLLRRHKEAEGR